MKDEQAARIQDLAFDGRRALPVDVKRQLVKIVEAEFYNQTTLHSAEAEAKKDEVLEAYKRRVGFKTLLKRLDAAKAAVQRAEEAIENVGLQNNGQPLTYTCGNEQKARAAARIRQQLDKAASAFEKPANYKNKIIARLYMATTQGEAAVILREVLGNGVIPSLDVNEVRALPAPEAR